MDSVIIVVLIFGSSTVVNGEKSELLYPNFKEPSTPTVKTPNISEENLRKAFDYAKKQVEAKEKTEEKYLNSENALSRCELSAEARLQIPTSSSGLDHHKVQEQFEEATKYLAESYNLTQQEITFGLPKVQLPEDIAVVRKCAELHHVDPCDESRKYRTMDGTCNNLKNPDWGKAGGCYRTMFPPVYDDGISIPRTGENNSPLPSARFLSAKLVRDANITSTEYTHMMMSWGQFTAHDTSRVTHPIPENKGFRCCSKDSSVDLPSSCFPIDIPEDDYFYSGKNKTCMNFVRSTAYSLRCKLGDSRRHLNSVTSFIDGSVIYENSHEKSKELRQLEKGLLQYQATNFGHMLSASTNPDCDQCSKGMQKNFTCFRSGDSRVNFQPGSVSMHTIWMREHNRIADILSRDYPSASDETIFQETRRIIGAQMQLITYKEFLPVLLGSKLMDHFQLNTLECGFSSYDCNTDPTVTTEFATGAFRFGHTLIQNLFTLVDENNVPSGNLDLQYNQMHPSAFYEGKMDQILRGFYHQGAHEFDRFFVTAIINHLHQIPGETYGLDIISVNLQRARDQGLPSYGQVLEYCFSVSVKSFQELNISMNRSSWEKLQEVYYSVDDIDFYAGGFSEERLSSGLVGPTIACVIGKHFQNLKYGDRFYFEHGNQAGSFTEGQLEEIRKGSLALVICDNSDGVKEISPEVFRSISSKNKLVDCKDLSRPDYKGWMEK